MSHFTSPSVEIKYVSYVCNALPPSLLGPDVEGTSDQFLLRVLDLHHLLLDGALGDELVDEGLLGLSHPVGAIEALFLSGWVPGRVEQKQVVGCRQIETHPTSH